MTNVISISKKIYYWYIALELLLVPIMLFPMSNAMISFIIVIDFFLGFIVLYYANMFNKKLAEKVSFYGLLTGVIFIFGGSALDMAVTVIYSPDLSLEGNPVLVTLLNNQFSLNTIYFFTLCYQLLKTTISFYLWIIFLKTYHKILKSIPYINFYTTIKWLLGAQRMRFLDLLLGRNIDFYFFIPTLFFVIVACNAAHWYAAMEWLGFIPIVFSSLTLAFVTISTSLLMLALISHIKIKNKHRQLLV